MLLTQLPPFIQVETELDNPWRKYKIVSAINWIVVAMPVWYLNFMAIYAKLFLDYETIIRHFIIHLALLIIH